MISSIFKAKLSNENLQKVTQVAKELRIDPNWLLGVMYFETGKTFSPSKTNSIGSTGLIQFTRDKAGVNYKTINGKRYDLAQLGRLSFIEQMDVVKEYYKPFIGKINSFIDTYLVTFFPLALGKDENFVFETKGLSSSLIAKQNPIFDADKNGEITKKEVLDHFRNWYGQIFETEINIKKKTQEIMNKLKDFYTKNKVAVLIFGGALALGAGYFIFKHFNHAKK